MGTNSLTLKALQSHIRHATLHRMPITVTDSEVRGLSARISPTGRVTWVASKSIGRGRGSTQRVVVGHFPGMSLDAARIEAGHVISRLAKGEDVVSQVKATRRAKVARRQCPTIKEAVADYLTQRSGDPTSRYEIELRQLFERQLVPELGVSTRVNAVTKADIRKLLKKRKDAGQYSRARYLMAGLRPFFDWCKHEEYITASPCIDIEAPPPSKRQHKLTDAEIVALWATSHSFGIVGCYWRLLLMLIQRRTELAGLRWREINLDRGEWIIPASRTKNKREHLVPLPRPAIAELQSLKQRTGEHDYVFGRYPSVPFSGFSKAKRELDAAMLAKLRESDPEAILSDWRIHDLRRTGASRMSGLKVRGHKVPPHIIEAILNHTPGTLEGTYQVWELHKYADEKRQALEAWANFVWSVVSEKPAISNVIALRS